MKKMTSRVVSFLFAILLLLPIFGDAVHALPVSGEEFVIENGVLTAYNGPGGDVVIPSGVKKISDHAFMKKSILKLTLNAELEEIGKYAFSDNAIKEVVFPDSVKKIDDYAFSDNLLESVAFSHVETVGEAAFKNNYIKTLDAGDKLVSLGDSAFTSNRLKEVTFPDSFTTMGKGIFTDNHQYVKVVGKNVASEFVKDHFGHVANPITITVSFVDRETKKEILSQKLLGNDLTKEGEVFSIGQTTSYPAPKINGYKAVSDTIAITPDADPYKVTVEYENRKKEPELIIPAKNFKTGDTIDKAKLLEGVVAKDLDGNDISSKVTVTPDHLDSIVGSYNVTYQVEDVYGNIAKKTTKVSVGINWPEIEVGKGWKIGDFTFNKNVVTGLSERGKEKVKTNKDLVIPDINDEGESVDTIGEKAFENLDANGVVCQKGIKNLGGCAFLHSKIDSFSAEGVTTISEDAIFLNCKSLTNISLPKLMAISGDGVFTLCVNLTNISFPVLTEISGGYVFRFCDGLTNISFPTLTTISGNNIFENCKKLTSVSFPALTTISGNNTFKACEKLTSISLPALTTISGDCTFTRCESLTAIHLPALTTISGDGTFSYVDYDRACDKLTTVSFPALTTISGDKTFAYCESLPVKLSFPKLQKITGAETFNMVAYDRLSIYGDPSVETFTMENYIFNPSNQTQTSTDDYVASDFTYVKEGVVAGLTASGIAKLKGHDGKLIFPNNVRDLAGNAFYKDSMITSVESETLTTISGTYAFFNCKNLTSVSFPALTTVSGSYVFSGCWKIKSLLINDFFDESKQTLQNLLDYYGVSNVIVYTKNRTNPNHIPRKTDKYILNPTILTIHYEDESGNVLKAPTVVEKLTESPYSMTLPSFDGYKTPELSAIPFDVEKAEDTYTVVYHKLTEAELRQISDQTKRIKFSQHLQNEKELPYAIGNAMVTRVSFDLSGYSTNLRNYIIELSVDPTYFDVEKTQVKTSSVIQSVTKTDSGVQIKLNSTYGGTSLDLPVTWYFKKYVTPENTQIPVRASLKNTYGNLYALAEPTYLAGKYEKPILKKKLLGLEDTGYYSAEEVDMKEQVVTDKEILMYTFNFGIDRSTGLPKQLDRNVSSYVLTDTLPMYIDKSGQKVRARFDEKENPGWKLSSDDTAVVYKERVEPTHSLDLPTLKLHTPNAIFHSKIENTATIALTPALKSSTENVMKASDSVNHYYRANVPEGDVFVKRIYMPHKGKTEGSSYFYDIQKERNLEFKWILFWQYGRKYNKVDVKDLRTLILEDYGLDSRMYYSGIVANNEFVGGTVSCVDSSGKTLLELDIDKVGTFAIPEVIGRNTSKLVFRKDGTNFTEGQHMVHVLTKLREPTKEQYSESSVIGVNTIRNQLKMHVIFADGSSATGDSYDDLGIRALKQKVHLSKTGIIGDSKSLAPGMEETYTLSLEKDSEVIINDLKDVEVVDLLPEPMEVKEVILGSGFAKEPTHAYRIVENYNNTRRTAVIFTADRYSLDNGNEIAKIKTVVREDMREEGNYQNEAFLSLGKGDVSISSPIKDVRIGKKDYSKATVSHTFAKVKELVARKYIKKASDTTWLTSGIFTNSNEAFDYKLTIINNTDVEHKNTKIIDILPFAGDTATIENQEGNRISRGSEFSNILDFSRPLSIPKGYSIYYLNSKVPDLTGKSLDAIEESWNWERTPSVNTTAIKIVANAGTVIPKNGRLDVIIPMKAPNNDNQSLSGKKAYNTFVRKDDITTSYIEPNRVYNEMTAPEGTIKLTKVGVSFTGKVNLAGAVFSLRDKDGNYLGSKTSDANGQVLFEHLSIAKDYVLEEVTAPRGYVKSDKKLMVKSSDLMNATNYFIDLGEVKNSKPWVPLAEPKGTFLFKKVDSENKSLEGALFSLVGKDGTSTAGLTYNRRSDVDGIVSFTNLMPGMYMLTELSSAGSLQVVKKSVTVKVNGVLPNTSQKPSVVIDGVTYPTDDKNATKLYTVKNDKAAVTLLKLGVLEDKKDKSPLELQTQDGIALPNAVFRLYRGRTLVKDNLKTDNEGKLVLSDLNVNTDYTIKEKTAPTDYKIIHSSITFRVDSKGKLTINGGEPISNYLIVPNLKEKKLSIATVTKTDGKKTLKGAEFTLSKKNGETYDVFATKVTSRDGVVSFDNLSGGEYKLAETKAPKGYVRSEKEELFTVDDYTQKTFTFNVVNKPLSFDVKKVTYIAKNVSKEKADILVSGNASYKMEANGAMYNVYEPLANAVFALREEGSQTTLQTLTSVSDGTLAIDKTRIDPAKNYELIELQAPAGYEKLVSPIPIRMKDFAKLSDFTGEVRLPIENKPIRGQIVASKYDEAKKQKLSGVMFGLYNEKREKIKSVKTNEIGNAIFTDLPLGTYYLKEEATLPGWRLPLDERKVVLTEANRSVAEVFYNKEQIPETGRNVLLYSAIGTTFLLGAYVFVQRKKKGVR